MLDIGWGELLLIGVVALIVVGPKELPGMFRTVGNFMGRARGMAREFQRSMEQAADESGLKDAAKDLRAVDKLRLNSATSTARDYASKLVKDIDDTAAAADPAPAAPRSEAPEPVKAGARPPSAP
jgi:sec-independent protein translocase protein TatB